MGVGLNGYMISIAKPKVEKIRWKHGLLFLNFGGFWWTHPWHLLDPKMVLFILYWILFQANESDVENMFLSDMQSHHCLAALCLKVKDAPPGDDSTFILKSIHHFFETRTSFSEAKI